MTKRNFLLGILQGITGYAVIKEIIQGVRKNVL